MTAYVYILRYRTGHYYVGSTRGSLERRVAEHNAGLCDGYTYRRRPVELIYSESFGRITDAVAAKPAPRPMHPPQICPTSVDRTATGAATNASGIDKSDIRG